MKIALAQINPVVGDFSFNASKIVNYAGLAREQGCELVVFSELALSGYPPQDLLERNSFLAAHDAAFEDLLAGIDGIGVVCGLIERHRGPFGKPLHNSAVLFENGDVLFTARKRLLPTYDVFDESRYFEPGAAGEVFSYKGIGLGITICEDIWNDKAVFSRKLYSMEPVADLVREESHRPDLLINISASPFYRGKQALKHRIFARLCRDHGLPLLYVNQVGGQDSLLFDGRSLVMDSRGRLAAEAAVFCEDLLVVDTSGLHPADGEKGDAGLCFVPGEDVSTVFDGLVMGVRDYVTKCGFSKAVLGLSGGIDSALTAVIGCAALGAENVLGVALPSPYTSPASVEDARQLTENLGCAFEVIPISDLFEASLRTLQPLFADWDPDVTEQNLQARIRGNLLMALSNKFGHLLLSTGNKTEMAVGYCTLYGDMSGGLAVIADVPKLLVYELARYANRGTEIIPARTLDRPPSAELAPDQRDEDDLPPYRILDPIVTGYLERHCSVDDLVCQGFERAVVEDVIRRINANEYKRKQAPPALKVTSKSFGPGRRYPTAQNFKEAGK